MSGFKEKPDTGVKHEASDGTILELEPIDNENMVEAEAAIELELEPLPDGLYDVEPRVAAEQTTENAIESEDAPVEQSVEEIVADLEVAEEEIDGGEKKEVSNNFAELQGQETEKPVEVSLDNIVWHYGNAYVNINPFEGLPVTEKRIKEINSILQQVSEGKLGMQYEKEKRSDGSYMVEKIKYEKGAGEIPRDQIESLSNTLKENEIEKSESAFEYVKSIKRPKDYENISLGDHKEFRDALDTKTLENNDFRKKITMGSFALAGTSLFAGVGVSIVLASPVGLPLALIGSYGSLAGGGLLRLGKGIYDSYKEKKAWNDYTSAFVAKGVREQISS